MSRRNASGGTTRQMLSASQAAAFHSRAVSYPAWRKRSNYQSETPADFGLRGLRVLGRPREARQPGGQRLGKLRSGHRPNARRDGGRSRSTGPDTETAAITAPARSRTGADTDATPVSRSATD